MQDALDLMRDDSAGEVDLEQCLALFRQMSSRDNNVIEIPSDVSNPLTRFPSDTIAMSMSNPPYPPSLPPLPQRSAALSIQSVKSVNVTEELLNMLEGNQQPTMQQLSIQQPPMNYNNPPMIIQPIINSTYMAPSVPSPHLLQHPHISPTYPPPYPHPHHQGVYSAVPSVVYHAYPSSVYGPPSPVGSYGYASSSSSYDHHAPPSSYDSTYRPPSGPPSHNPSPHQGEPFDFSSGSADTYQEYMRTDYPSSSGLVGAPYSHPVHPLHHPHYPPSHPGHPDYSTHYENVRIGAGSGTTSKKKKDKAAAASADRANNRGNYHCGRCGMLKANHVCAFVDAPPVTDKGVQVNM
ncbi:hypothetical protein EON65_55420 [archaeon]|nr:MAG: hypothetical protein EON65_55420 [archaeon]